MREHDVDAAWGELGRIDYLLNELARSVERGDLPRASYDTLTPRYLARRAEILALISGETRAEVSEERPPTVPAFATTPPEGVTAAPVAAAPVASAPNAAVFAVVEPVPSRESKPVPWTTILTFVGAFLVVVAAAIFAVATWEYFGVGFRLAFLGGLTVAFYLVGDYVHRRLELTAGGVALTVVGSAMLLFDGWIVIDGFDLAGPLPWAVVLLVCSGVYWFTEVRLSGGFFGAIGAAAQAAWWWLLGAGLGWSVAPRMAGCALVALAWAWAAVRARDNPALGSLARVLRIAALVLAGLTVVGEVWGLVLIVPGWTEILASAVVGVAVAVTFEISDVVPARLRALPGFVAQLPLFVTVIRAMPPQTGWDYFGVFVVLAVVYALWELYRGGYFFGALALVAELGAWMILGTVLEWDRVLMLGVFGTVALSWVVVSSWLPRWLSADERAWRGTASMSRVAEVGGWVVLALSTLAVPGVSGGVPLTYGVVVGVSVVATSVWLLAMWAAAALLRRDVVSGAVVEVWSFWVLASVLAWATPIERALAPSSAWWGLPSGHFYALSFIALAAVWLHGRSLAERLLSMRPAMVAVIARTASALALVGGIANAVAWSRVDSWQTIVLLLAGCAFWVADVARGGWTWGAALAAGLAVASAGLGAWVVGSENTLAVVAPLAAVLVVAASVALRRREQAFSTPMACGALAVASFAPLWALQGLAFEPLSISLVCLGLAWAIGSMALDLPECTGIAALLGLGALVAAFEARQPQPWVVLTLLSASAYALLAPSWVWARTTGFAFRAARATAIVGAVALLFVCALASMSVAGLPLPAWAALGAQARVVGLLVLGVYVVGASWLYGLDPGLYVGVAVLLLAIWDELRVLDVEWVEFYSTALAAYLVAMTYLYIRRAPGHRVPVTPDLAAVFVGLGVPVMLSIRGSEPAQLWGHAVWAVGLSLVAIVGGVAGRVRAYFFGGVVALVLTAVFRSLLYLVEFWWITLGVIGIAMLVIALTWERERVLVTSTGRKVRETFSGWR